MADQTLTPSEFALDEERRMLALESIWDIDAMVALVRDIADGLGSDPDPDVADLARTGRQLRTLAMRIETLNGVAMSVLSEDDDTQNLGRKVHGLDYRPMYRQEVANV